MKSEMFCSFVLTINRPMDMRTIFEHQQIMMKLLCWKMLKDMDPVLMVIAMQNGPFQ